MIIFSILNKIFLKTVGTHHTQIKKIKNKNHNPISGPDSVTRKVTSPSPPQFLLSQRANGSHFLSLLLCVISSLNATGQYCTACNNYIPCSVISWDPIRMEYATVRLKIKKGLKILKIIKKK